MWIKFLAQETTLDVSGDRNRYLLISSPMLYHCTTADKISFIFFFHRAITQYRGIILMGKICVSYFFMRNHNMKFQNPSMQGSKLCCVSKSMECIKCPILQRAITHKVFCRIYSKVNQVIYLFIPIYSPGFKALALISF